MPALPGKMQKDRQKQKMERFDAEEEPGDLTLNNQSSFLPDLSRLFWVLV